MNDAFSPDSPEPSTPNLRHPKPRQRQAAAGMATMYTIAAGFRSSVKYVKTISLTGTTNLQSLFSTASPDSGLWYPIIPRDPNTPELRNMP